MSIPLIIGNRILKLDAVDSSNTYAHSLLKNQNTSEGLIIWAKNQLKGRGQMGTIWHSHPEKSLTFSVILSPHHLSINDQFLFNQCICNGVHAYLTSILGNDVKIKWPNDILYKGKKLCGILIENFISGSKITNSIAGIGINLNQSAFPDLPFALSLKMITQKHYDQESTLHSLIIYLNAWYLKLVQGKYDEISGYYTENLWKINEEISYVHNTVHYKGIIRSVKPNGELQIEQEDGGMIDYRFKEIEFELG